MVRFLTKGKIQKTILVIIAMLLLNFIAPKPVSADLGGILLSPIAWLTTTVGDSLLWALQSFLNDESTSFTGYVESEDKHEDGHTLVDSNKNVYIKEDDLATGGFWGMGDYEIPVGSYSPEEIFSGKIAGLDINFIDPESRQNAGGTQKSSSYVLHDTIASWYTALRSLSIVGLLSVLVYIGIRILLSSASSEKAKYKQMIVDWLIALCLLFFLHYIMSFTIYLTQAITDMIRPSDGGGINVIVSETGDPADIKKDGEKQYEFAFNTNLAGYMRIMTQSENGSTKITFLILYVVMVAYTVMFTMVYLKRVLYMAFLTIIAPLVALTYPIDKISDGKAQAFDTWLKEYVFNALLQPFHLLLYTVLVGAAMDLAVSNPLYSIVAMAFILSGEKILRKMFGFEKAATAGSLGGFASGALASTLFSKMSKGGAKVPGKAAGKVPGGNEGSTNHIRTGNTAGNDTPNHAEAFAEGLEDDPNAAAGGMSEGNSGAMPGESSGAMPGEMSGGLLGNGSDNGGSNNKQIVDASGNPISSADDDFMGRARNMFAEDGGTMPGGAMPGGAMPEGADNSAETGTAVPGGSPGGAIGGAAGPSLSGGRKKNRIKGAMTLAGKYAPRLGRFAFRTMGATAGAIAGAGIGIATGDAGKAFRFAAAGAAAGRIGADRLDRFAESVPSRIKEGAGNIRNAYNEGAIGKEAAVKEQRRREFMSDKGVKDFVKNEFFNADGSALNAEQRKQMAGRLADLNAAGIKDAEEMKTAIKLQDQEKLTTNQSINAVKSARGIKDSDFMDTKKRTEMVNFYQQSIMEAGRKQGKNYNAKAAQANAKKSVRAMMIAKGLTPPADLK